MTNLNPVLHATSKSVTFVEERTASFKGVTWKTFFLFFLVLLSAGLTAALGFTLNNAGSGELLVVKPWLLYTSSICGIVAFISILIASLAPKSAFILGPIYALTEGVIIGFITTIVGFYAPAIAITAASATLSIFLICLFINMVSSLRAKARFMKFFMAITMAFFIIMIISVILRFAAPSLFINTSNNNPNLTLGIAIGISLLFILYGAFMLSADFIYAEQIVNQGLGKRYEWSAALGIIFSLIWIYIEIIRLLILLSQLFKR